MKILILNSARKFIGEAAHTLDLTEQLLHESHDPFLVVKKNSLLEERARERHFPAVTAVGFAGRDAGLRGTIKDFFILRNLLLRFQPDVLHCHSGNEHSIAAILLLTLPRRKRPALVRTRHRVMPVRNTPGNRWLYRKMTDHIIAVSRKSAESFGPLAEMLKEKTSIIYSAVDTEGFNPARRSAKRRRELGVEPDEPLIGLIARLQRVKGQDPFLRAAAIVLEKYPMARFLIAGTGRAHKKERLEALAEQLGIRERVILMDWLPDVQEVTACLDIGILASLGSEGSSRVTYEYMASGVAVIATTVGCLPELIIDGQNGFLVPPGDSEAMGAAIIRMLQTPQLRSDMQSQARMRMEQFHNRKRWVQETIQVYQKALDSRRR